MKHQLLALILVCLSPLAFAGENIKCLSKAKSILETLFDDYVITEINANPLPPEDGKIEFTQVQKGKYKGMWQFKTSGDVYAWHNYADYSYQYKLTVSAVLDNKCQLKKQKITEVITNITVNNFDGPEVPCYQELALSCNKDEVDRCMAYNGVAETHQCVPKH